MKLISVPPFQMGKTSYRGQGPRSRGQAITRGRGQGGRGGARQIGGPQRQAYPVHPSNDRRPNGNDRRQYSDGRTATRSMPGLMQNFIRFTHSSDLSNIWDLSTNVWDLIPNRKRKPTPSIAVTSNATSIRTMKRQQQMLDQMLTHILKPTLNPDSKAEPFGSV